MVHCPSVVFHCYGFLIFLIFFFPLHQVQESEKLIVRLLVDGMFVAWAQWRANSLRGYVKEWFPGPTRWYRLGTKEEPEGTWYKRGTLQEVEMK